VLCAVCPSSGILSCHTYIQGVTKFENFDAEILVFLWYVQFENHPLFEGNNNFINSQIFRRVVKFEKCASKNFKQVSYLPQPVKIFVSPIRFIPVVTKM
jgi:ribosomal protein L31